LREECARLRAALQAEKDLHETTHAERIARGEEIKRLRAALREIIYVSDSSLWEDRPDIREIAQQALREELEGE
jgi:hypothetical protein